MNPVLSRTLSTTARMSAAASMTMLLASTLHRGAPWAGINAMTRAVQPDRRTPKKFASERSLLGLAVLTVGLGATCAIYEAALARAPRQRGMVTGTLLALSGYAIDRWLLPKPLLRSFERTMGPVGTFAKYAALALAAAAPAGSEP
jgi:hypothetical protein